MGVVHLEESLNAHGFDVVQTLNAQWYNKYVETEKLPLSPLPTFGKSGALAILIGNSKAVWPEFLRFLAERPDAETMADPLDTYISLVISEAIEDFVGNAKHEIFWGWDSGERLVSMQRVAIVSGLCYHDSETQLAIHPKFGAWIAFRALLVVEYAPTLHGVGATPPPRMRCLLTETEKTAAKKAMKSALQASDEANLCTQLHGAAGMQKDVRLAWAALRDCVGVGREHRYCSSQLNYHYTKDRALLLAEVRKLSALEGIGRSELVRSWMVSLLEVVLTFLLPFALVYLVSGKMPGKEGDDVKLHKLSR